MLIEVVMKNETQKYKRVFHLSNPADLFKKLDWEIDNLRDVMASQPKQLPLNHEVAAYHAFNSVVTAWHLTDWVWTSLSDQEQNKLAEELGFEISNNSQKNLGSFQKAIRSKSGVLKICWEIANGSKHLENHKNSEIDAQVNLHSKIATASEFRAGHPLQTFTFDFVVLIGNKEFKILDILEGSKEFWLQLLFKLGFLKDIYAKIEFKIEKTNSGVK